MLYLLLGDIWELFRLRTYSIRVVREIETRFSCAVWTLHFRQIEYLKDISSNKRKILNRVVSIRTEKMDEMLFMLIYGLREPAIPRVCVPSVQRTISRRDVCMYAFTDGVRWINRIFTLSYSLCISLLLCHAEVRKFTQPSPSSLTILYKLWTAKLFIKVVWTRSV